MNKDNVDIQDYLDDMADGFLDGMGTSEEFARVQALISQAFCFGLNRQQQTIESLKAQLAQYQSDDWISVKDRLPELKQGVIVYMSNKVFHEYPFAITTYCKHGFDLSNVTHWQPLPNPPKGASK